MDDFEARYKAASAARKEMSQSNRDMRLLLKLQKEELEKQIAAGR